MSREYFSWQRKLFQVALVVLLVAACLTCVIPFLNVLALSFSHKVPASQGHVDLLPMTFDETTKQTRIGISLTSYEFILKKPEFLRSFWVSVQRVFLSSVLSMFLTIITAYPLSKSNRELRGRTAYVWFFVVTMLVGGGLVPWYIIIQKTGLLNSIWALVIPGALPVFNMVLLLNFFRGIPKSIEESALIDGANHWQILWRMIVPLSTASIATLLLFNIVGSWNSWFDGLILMQQPRKYPLQSYLQTLLIATSREVFTRAKADVLKQISDRTVKAAQIFVAAVPMLLLYPFLQNYFMTGIVLGSVKE